METQSFERSVGVFSSLPGPFLDHFFVDGEWRKPRSGASHALVSQLNGQRLVMVADGSPADMNDAVAAARRSFDSGIWSARSFSERAAVLKAIADRLREHQTLAAELWTAQVATPISFANYLIGQAADVFDYYARLGQGMESSESHVLGHGKALVFNEPVGVVAIVTPWNAPLVLLAFSAAAALLAGCSIVSKPSPESPLDGLLLAHCARLAGLPAVVLNVVPAGAESGEHLVNHLGVDKISFTGSTAVGKSVGAMASARVARCTLELGGKSAAIILEDADLVSALGHILPMSMPFSGQICFALTRILVPHSRANELASAYVEMVRGMRLGDPWNPETQMGPVVSARQQQRILDYIESGKSSGARLLVGGGRPKQHTQGYFVEPTVFSEVPLEARIAQEEIFGPVVCFQTYQDEEEAIRIANGTSYGLSGAVFTADTERGLALARRMRSGSCGLNITNVQPEVPSGGFGQSGIGRIGGLEGLRSYQEPKTIYLPSEHSSSSI